MTSAHRAVLCVMAAIIALLATPIAASERGAAALGTVNTTTAAPTPPPTPPPATARTLPFAATSELPDANDKSSTASLVMGVTIPLALLLAIGGTYFAMRSTRGSWDRDDTTNANGQAVAAHRAASAAVARNQGKQELLLSGDRDLAEFARKEREGPRAVGHATLPISLLKLDDADMAKMEAAQKVLEAQHHDPHPWEHHTLKGSQADLTMTAVEDLL